ncbi:MAG: radical SAM protein [bacterium]
MQRVTLIALYDEYCLGVRYMSSVLKQDGHEVHLILFKGVECISPAKVPPPERREEGGYYSFATFSTPREVEILLDCLRRQDPDLIGLSFSSISFGLACFLTRKIKEVFKVPVIWGGVDSTINPEENIQHTDLLCVGEGEYPLRELVRAMDAGKDTTRIPSLWIHRDGNVIRNPLMKLEQNLDNYPFPDYELENKTLILEDGISPHPYPPHSHLYTNFMVMGTRGCPFSCTYCCSGHHRQIYAPDKFLRQRSPENMIEELKYRLRTWPWPIQRIEFYDDVLPLNKAWLRELAPRYAAEIRLPFFGYTHPNVGEPENLALLREAGLSYLIMGIQSGSQRVLNEVLNRRHTKARTLQTARNILETGAKLLVDFIGHNPLVREEDNLETLELICDLPKPCGIIKINPMAFYDHYRIQEIAREQGILDQMERPVGVHAYQAIPKPEFVFWEMIHTLAQFEGFSKPVLMQLASDPFLRENPGFLEETVTSLYQATYQDGNPAVLKDEYVQELRWRLARLERSPVVRAYQKVKPLLPGDGR